MNQFDLLIRNGDAVLPHGVERADIGVRDGKIVALGVGLVDSAESTLDAGGRLVLPGLIDPHTHMGIPIKDTHSADDFRSGSIAAACGGTTTILDFTVQAPGQTLRAALDDRLALADGRSHIDYGIHVNITDRPDDHLDAIPRLIADGFNSFKVFSTYREAGMMITWPQFRRVLGRIHAHGGLLMLHAEDNDQIEANTTRHVMGGQFAAIYHPRSRTADAEAAAVAAAAAVADDLGARLYIVHLSSRAGLEAGLRARARGVDIVLETCPQYLVLTEEAYLGLNGHHFITTPPLRRRSDVDALWEAVADGAIDTIGTDHCPFTVAQKDAHGGLFHLTPNGMPGVENRLPVLYTAGVATGRIDMLRLVDLLASNAARIFGIDRRKGSLAVGQDADLVIWKPDGESVVSAESLHGNADWSPYAGMTQIGRLTHTFLRGQCLVADGQFVGHAVRGVCVRADTASD